MERTHISERSDRGHKAKEEIMTLVRWNDPISSLTQLQDRINRVFSDSYGRSDEGLMTSGTWVPPVDIYQNDEKEVVLKAELPDMTKEDIDVTVDNGMLTIKGEKKFSQEVKEENLHRIERRYGSFSRAFSLPQTVDTTKVGADYKNGVLTVRLPIREEAKPKQVKVQVGA
jgi:HSP20 family protein